MNAANTVILIFCLAMASMIHMIFSERWQTPYGARIPFKRVQQKYMLIVPAFFALLGTFSFFTSGWEDPLEAIPKWLAISVYLTTILCLVRWYMSKDPMMVPIDVVMKHYWPHAQRIDLAEHTQKENMKNGLKNYDTFIVTNTSGLEILQVYLGYVKSLGQTLVGGADIEVIDEGTKMYSFEAEEKTDKETLIYQHKIMRIDSPPIVAFYTEIL